MFVGFHRGLADRGGLQLSRKSTESWVDNPCWGDSPKWPAQKMHQETLGLQRKRFEKVFAKESRRAGKTPARN
jgi:hypothetical protein